MFDRFRTRHLRADVSLVSQLIGELTAVRAGTGTPVPYDQLPITQGTASLIADALAAMPLAPFDEYTGAPLPVDRYPVLMRPNPEEDRADTVHKIAQALYWTGNAHALNGPVDPATGAVEAITVVNPNAIGPDVDPLDELRVAGWFLEGRRVPRSAVTHWKLNDDPRRGPLGASPLKRCATALDTYGWAYRYLADYFANGGQPSSVIRSKVELDPTKITELAKEWVAARQYQRPAFLPNWLELDVPANNGELEHVVRVLGFAAAEVARALNMPVSLVNAPVEGYSLQYSNAGEEFRRWLATSLGTTWIARIERGFSQLMPDGVIARLDPSQLYRTDLYPDQSATTTATARLDVPARSLEAGQAPTEVLP